MKNLKSLWLLLGAALIMASCGSSSDPAPDVAPNVIGTYRGTLSLPGNIFHHGVDLQVVKTGTNAIEVSDARGPQGIAKTFQVEVREISSPVSIQGSGSFMTNDDYVVFKFMNNPSVPTELSYSLQSLNQIFVGNKLDEIENIAAQAEGVYDGLANASSGNPKPVKVRVSRNSHTNITIGEEGTAGIIQTISDIEIVGVTVLTNRVIYEAMVSGNKVDLSITLNVTPHVIEFTNKTTGNTFIGDKEN